MHLQTLALLLSLAHSARCRSKLSQDQETDAVFIEANRESRQVIGFDTPTTYILPGIVVELPFMVILMNKNRQFCRGSLIDDQHILTAAHCVDHMIPNHVNATVKEELLDVVLGDDLELQDNDAFRLEVRIL